MLANVVKASIESNRLAGLVLGLIYNFNHTLHWQQLSVL